MGLISRAMNTYQSSQSNNSSIPFSNRPSSSTAVNRTAESSASPYADSKDIVRASADPPPYTQYADEQPGQPQPPLQTMRQLEPQAQAAQIAYQNAQYQPAAQYQTAPPRQLQTQEYRYQMDPPQNYDGAYGSDQGGRRRRGRKGRRSGGGPMHMLMIDGKSNQQYQSRPDMYDQPGYGYDDNIDPGRGRRGRRGGRGGGGGPLHMLFDAARKL